MESDKAPCREQAGVGSHPLTRPQNKWRPDPAEIRPPRRGRVTVMTY